MIETLGPVPYCSIPRSRKSRKKPLVQYLTAASLDQGNHDRNFWFSTLQQHPSTKEIMMETFGSVTFCRTLDQGNHGRKTCFSTLLQQPSIKEIMIETHGSDLTAASIDQVNHDRNPWSSTLLQHSSIKEITTETLGSIPYCSISRPRKS